MVPEHEPEVVAELAAWCSLRVEGREARRRRMPVLLKEFSDLLNDRTPIITVAGTSGKGTTCALLEAVLIASGHTPGVCTKPHLFAFRERIRVAGRWASNAELSDHVGGVFARLRQFVARHGPAFRPALFEAILLVAASIFRSRGVTIEVYEAAIGGANDATSHLPARVSVITSVDLDHQGELGDTVEAIAEDKAGIARPGGVLIVGAAVGEAARSVATSTSARRGVRCVQADEGVIQVLSDGVEGQTIRITDADRACTLRIPFPGPWQARNAATAWAATKVLHELRYVDNPDAIRGVERAWLPGRFEFVRGSPSWLLDVAHNAAAIQALTENLSRSFSRDRVAVVLGATARHDYRTFAPIIGSWGARVAYCEGFARAVPAPVLAAEAPNQTRPIGLFRTPAEAVNYFLGEEAYREMTVVVTGSLFLVGAWRQELVRRKILAGEER